MILRLYLAALVTLVPQVSGNIVCNLTESGLGNCIRKCCPKDYVAGKNCVKDDRDLLAEGLKVYSGRKSLKTLRPPASGLLTGLQCGVNETMLYAENKEWYLQEDGRLAVTSLDDTLTYYDPTKYCLDSFVTTSQNVSVISVRAVYCLPPVYQGTLDSWRCICMLISSVFILATLGVYAWLPELRNLHGQVLMCYLGCLFAGFLLLGSIKLKQFLNDFSQEQCYPFGVVCYVFLIATFFWLNVMCYDIYWTFSGQRGLINRQQMISKRFIGYCAYAFGLPILLTALMMGLEYSGIRSKYMPNFRKTGCFLYGYGKYIYFCVPVGLLCVFNFGFFVITSFKIFRVNRQTSVLNSSESARHDRTRMDSDKQRFFLYIKLFVVMGVNWILEIIEIFCENKDDSNIFFVIADAYNCLLGVTIFCLFVCKKKIFLLIRNRCRPQHVQQTSQRTTTTSSSSREEMKLATKNKRSA